MKSVGFSVEDVWEGEIGTDKCKTINAIPDDGKIQGRRSPKCSTYFFLTEMRSKSMMVQPAPSHTNQSLSSQKYGNRDINQSETIRTGR